MIKRIAIVAMLLTLCACSGRTSTAGATTPAAAIVGPTASASAGVVVKGQTGNSVTTGKGGSTAVSVPDQLCVFLNRELLKVSSASSPTMAQKAAGKDYKTWVAQDKNRKVKAAELDPMTKTQCPKVRSRILSTLNSASLAGALS